MKKQRLQLLMLSLLFSLVVLFPCLAEIALSSPAVPSIAVETATTGTTQTLPVNYTDQSATLQKALNSGVREIRLAPGMHRLAKAVTIPEGTQIVGYNATLDIATPGWAFLLQGSLRFEGVEIIRRVPADAPNTILATGIGGDPRIGFDRCTVNVQTTIQNIKTVGATNSTFHAVSMWKNARIENCTFHADTYIGGEMKFIGNTMRGRLIANAETGGLNKALVKHVRWEGVSGIDNLQEALLFENCDVIDSTFDTLQFKSGCVTLIEWWAVDGQGNMTPNKCLRNTFKNILSDGPTAIGLRFIGGETDGNLIQNVSLHRVTFPVLLENGCKANKFEYLYVIDCVPVVQQGGFEPWVWWNATRFHERFIIRDDGEATKVSWMYVEGARGIKVSNRPERITQLSEN